MANDTSGSKINPVTGHPAAPVKLNPDAVTEEEGVRQLLSSLSPKEGGWNPDGHETRIGHKKNGVWVITYTFDASGLAKPGFHLFPSWDEVRNLRRLKKESRKLVSEITAIIEQNANIRFEHVAEDGDINRADIRFFRMKEPPDKDTGADTDGKLIRNIRFAESHTENPHSILHEILHALGLSHPGANGLGGKAGGDNESYNKDTTVMSYNKGDMGFTGLGPFDVAALQKIYGPSKNCSTPMTLGPANLVGTRFIDAGSVTLDLRDERYKTGGLTVREGKIEGALATDEDKEFTVGQETGTRVEVYNPKPVKLRMVGDTKIKDVLADNEHTNVKLRLTGNELPNRLQGGKATDELTPRGGLDVLTGNGGWDEFGLDSKSGFDNTITDFDPSLKQDVLKLQAPIAKVELRPNDILREGKLYKATEVWARDKEGNSVASVQVLGVTPEELKKHGSLVYEVSPEDPFAPPRLPFFTKSARKGVAE